MVILYIIVLLLAFPSGYLLAWLAKDELVLGRKWFLILSVISLLSAVAVFFSDFKFKFPSIISLFFVMIISLLAVWKSYQKNFVK